MSTVPRTPSSSSLWLCGASSQPTNLWRRWKNETGAVSRVTRCDVFYRGVNLPKKILLGTCGC